MAYECHCECEAAAKISICRVAQQHRRNAGGDGRAASRFIPDPGMILSISKPPRVLVSYASLAYGMFSFADDRRSAVGPMRRCLRSDDLRTWVERANPPHKQVLPRRAIAAAPAVLPENAAMKSQRVG
jgi:hypothetical protein